MDTDQTVEGILVNGQPVTFRQLVDLSPDQYANPFRCPYCEQKTWYCHC